MEPQRSEGQAGSTLQYCEALTDQPWQSGRLGGSTVQGIFKAHYFGEFTPTGRCRHHSRFPRIGGAAVSGERKRLRLWNGRSAVTEVNIGQVEEAERCPAGLRD